MICNGKCKPGTLLCLTRDTVRRDVFQLDFVNHDDQKVALRTEAFKGNFFILRTEAFKGDFFIWLQDDNHTPPFTEYSFCLHNKTGRILSMPNYLLEIVDLKGEVE